MDIPVSYTHLLMGRALGNNLINLQAYEDVEEALEELGIDINTVAVSYTHLKASKITVSLRSMFLK